MKLKQLAILFVSFCLIFTQYAQARRFGGGRNYGSKGSYSRSYSGTNNSPSTANHGTTYQNNYSTQHSINQQNPAPQKRRMGAGTAAALGAAAGVAGGYMLGKSMSNNQEPTNQNLNNNKSQASDGVNTLNSNSSNNNEVTKATEAPTYNSMIRHLPWGVIAILFILLILGLCLFRNKIPANNRPEPITREMTREEIQQFVMTQQAKQGYPSQPLPASFTPPNHTIMQDGVEALYFLRQVKGMFLHIQSMNNAENITEIQKYMTPELYNQMYNEIKSNTSIADFQRLDCNLTDSSEDDNYYLASVKFNGLVSEEVNQPAVNFCEIWHFVKPKAGEQRWLIAGIEQVAVPPTPTAP